MATTTQQSQPPADSGPHPPTTDVPGSGLASDSQSGLGGAWILRRQTLNVFIDVAALLAAGALAGSGFILAYRLPPGRGNHDLSILGWRRHDWGDLHQILAWVVIGLMVVHLLLHLNWLMHACASFAKRCGVRTGLWFLPVGILLVTAALIAVPCILPIHGAGVDVDVGEPHQQASSTGPTGTPVSQAPHVEGTERAIRLNGGRIFEIRGSTLLSEIAVATGLNGAQLRLALGVATDCPGTRTMKEIANDLGVGMSELRSRIQAALGEAVMNGPSQ